MSWRTVSRYCVLNEVLLSVYNFCSLFMNISSPFFISFLKQTSHLCWRDFVMRRVLNSAVSVYRLNWVRNHVKVLMQGCELNRFLFDVKFEFSVFQEVRVQVRVLQLNFFEYRFGKNIELFEFRLTKILSLVFDLSALFLLACCRHGINKWTTISIYLA